MTPSIRKHPRSGSHANHPYVALWSVWRKKKALSSLSDFGGGWSCRDNPEGPIQINTLLLTSSQTCSLHYHSIKTAYLKRPSLFRCCFYCCRRLSQALSELGVTEAEVEAARWDVVPLTDEEARRAPGVRYLSERFAPLTRRDII